MGSPKNIVHLSATDIANGKVNHVSTQDASTLSWLYQTTKNVTLGGGATLADKVSNAPVNGIPTGWTVVAGDDVSVDTQLSGTSNDLVIEHNSGYICTLASAVASSGTTWTGTLVPPNTIITNSAKTQTIFVNLAPLLGSAGSVISIRFV